MKNHFAVTVLPEDKQYMFARGFPVLTNKQGKDRLNFNCASHHVLDCLLGIKRHMLGHDDVAELPQVGH